MFSNTIYNKGGFFNCLKTIIKEEGPLALYRGYFSLMFAVMILMTGMPIATDFLMSKMPIDNIEAAQIPSSFVNNN